MSHLPHSTPVATTDLTSPFPSLDLSRPSGWFQTIRLRALPTLSYPLFVFITIRQKGSPDPQATDTSSVQLACSEMSLGGVLRRVRHERGPPLIPSIDRPGNPRRGTVSVYRVSRHTRPRKGLSVFHGRYVQLLLRHSTYMAPSVTKYYYFEGFAVHTTGSSSFILFILSLCFSIRTDLDRMGHRVQHHVNCLPRWEKSVSEPSRVVSAWPSWPYQRTHPRGAIRLRTP